MPYLGFNNIKKPQHSTQMVRFSNKSFLVEINSLVSFMGEFSAGSNSHVYRFTYLFPIFNFSAGE